MKRIILSLILLPIITFAQQANDWINYSQSYFKFPIVNDGVYRVTYQQLMNSGVNLTNIDPRNIQIFSKGKEQPIYIEGESDGTFDGNDFIELYCEHNDGWYDNELFSDSAHALNPYYSMFSDTAFYFLTWNNLISNVRMVSEVDLDFNAYNVSPYFWNEVKLVGKSNYNHGQTTSAGYAFPEYSNGEGWYDSQVNAQKSSTKTLPSPISLSEIMVFLSLSSGTSISAPAFS